MPNDRLREAITTSGLTYADVGTSMGVDPKTVERWVTLDRLPYRKNRNALAAMVKESEAYLWPQALTDDRKNEVADSEVIHVFPKRSMVPNDLWHRLLNRDSEQIELLVYAGLFLPELEDDLPDILNAKAEHGARVRLLMADPEANAVQHRGDEEGIGDALAARVRNALTYFKSPDHDAIDMRLHATTLYNSIFRFDDEMLVSAHVYGIAGAHAPVLHLKRIAGGELFETYRQAFERVWSSGTDASAYR